MRAVVGALVLGLASGCAVSGGRAVVTPPGVVVEPPTVYSWRWAPLPHYDVEHHVVVEHRVVTYTDHHYYPFYDRVHPPHDHGKHKGWFKHDHEDHDRDD